MSDSNGSKRLELEAQRQAWLEALGEELPLVELPAPVWDRPRPPASSFYREHASIELTPEATAALDRLAVAGDGDRFDTLLAALAGVLESIAAQTDLVVATATSDASSDGATGCNGLLLRLDVSRAATSGELLAVARAAVREAGARRDVPLTEVLEITATPASALRVIALPDGLASHLCPDGTDAFELQDALGEHASAADLVILVGGGEHCELRADYDGELFEPARIEALLARLARMAEGLARGADTPIGEIELLSDAEASTLEGWNATAVEAVGERCIHELVAQQAQRTPDAIALRFCDQALTYAELDRRANSLAARLREQGVGPDVTVGLWVPRSIEMLVCVLGVLKAGGAYVPMDPTYPANRIAYMREDSGVRVVLSRSDVDGARELPGVLLIDELAVEGQAMAPDSGVAPENLAYVIYTSGSTGNPKGVMIEHRQAVNFFAGMDERIGSEPGRWLAVTSLSFDISVLELLWTLARGFEVVIHSVAEEAVSGEATAARHDATGVGFTLFYFGSDDGEAADLFGTEKYRLLIEGAKFADEAGFDAVWTPERHFHIFGGMFPSPAVAASALAMLTENIQLRSGSVVLPLHDPVRVAEEWQLVDNLSNGRVGLSVASGWQPNDFVFRPENYEQRHDVMFEGIETVRALWRGMTRRATGGDGKDVEFITRPRPVQPELPVWVTAGGSPDTFERAGAAGANLLTHLLGQSLEELGEKIRIYREAWKRAGHPGQGIVSLMLHSFVGPDPEQVRAKVHGPLKEYLKGSVSLFKPFAEVLGLDVKNLTPEDIEALGEHAFDRYYETSGLFGTPESCVERIAQVKRLGVDEVACLIDFGIARQDVLDHLPYLKELRDRCEASDAPIEGDFSIPGLLRAHDISHFQCTPSMASMLLAGEPSRRALSALDVMMVGGEAFPMQVAQQLRELLPEGRILNMYGPTETTIWSSTWELDGLEHGITVGTPIANTQLYVLDRHGRRVPPGGIGELVIGGDGVVRGYHERPELTADRFVPNPFAGGEARMYRTGDMARFRPDGTVDFLGRRDHQVKFRGYRIEMGEIEAALCEHESVAEAAVIVREDGADKRLVAYLVPRSGATIAVDAIRDHLKVRLTEYMVPTAYVLLEALPLTPNKKVDRKALPAPVERHLVLSEDEKPESELEALIADIWTDVLKLPSVGTRDNFFDLGGHSLLAMHVLNQLRERCEHPVVMTDLFRFPTIKALAAHLAGDDEGPSQATEAGKDRAATRKARMGQRRRRRS
jgi:natural product biosynthesis luciferase-like monooxygenase protein